MEKNNWIWILAIGAGFYFWNKSKSGGSASIVSTAPVSDTTALQTQTPVVAAAIPSGQISQIIAQSQSPISQIPVAVVSDNATNVAVSLPPVISQQSTINDYGNIVSSWSPNITNQYNV